MSDIFWTTDFTVLFDPKRLREFVPSKDMYFNEKLNAIARATIYITIILILYYGKFYPIYYAIGGLLFTWFIHKYHVEHKPIITNHDIEGTTDRIPGPEASTSTQEVCTPPTRNNPFMNVTVNEYLDNPTRPEACDYNEVEETVEDNFNYNLYKDINDIWGKNNSQNRFVTNPSTTIPNDQGAFAKWLYDVPSTCKEDGEACMRYEDVRFNRAPIGYFQNYNTGVPDT